MSEIILFFSDLHFEYPYILYLILLFIFCEKFCPLRSGSIMFPNLRFFNSLSLWKFKVATLFKWTAILSVIIALSSPYYILKESMKPKDGLNIALVLDTSESMRSLRFSQKNQKMNRFDVVKLIVNDFIKERQNDNLGIVVFGEYAFISSPLTFDKKILSQMLEQLQIGIAGKSTAIYDALGQSVTLLKNESTLIDKKYQKTDEVSENKNNNIAILLTDGMNTAGKISKEDSIDLLKKNGIKVYTVGIGRRGEYNPVVLQDIAQQTNGKFFMASTSEQLEAVYREINHLETREIRNINYEIKQYIYFYPLLVAIISLIIYITLRNRKEFF
jgi:Ca-activated chloride channel family protein